MTSVTTKEGDLKNGHKAHGADIHLAVSGCDGLPPLTPGIVWRRSSQRIAQNTLNLRNPFQELLPVAPQLRSPPQHVGRKRRSLEIFLNGSVLHQPVGLRKQRQYAHRFLAKMAFEPPDKEPEGVTGPDAGQVAEIIAMRPKRILGVAMRTFRGWPNLPLVIFRDILLCIHRHWLDPLQLAQRQVGKRQRVQFVAYELFLAGCLFLIGGKLESLRRTFLEMANLWTVNREARCSDLQVEQIAETLFNFIHLVRGQHTHAPGELIVVEARKSLHIDCGMFWKPAGFAKIHFASHSTYL